MNSLQFLNKLMDLLESIPGKNIDDMLLPMKVNGVPVRDVDCSVVLDYKGNRFVNLTINNE